MTGKIFNDNPLKCPVVCISRCLDPHNVVNNENEAIKAYTQLRQDLIERKLVSNNVSDAALPQMFL